MSKSEREAELEDRVDELEDTVQKMLPGRRDMLAGSAVAGAGLLGFGAGTASADGHNDGDTQWGADANRDDYVVDHVDANSISSDELLSEQQTLFQNNTGFSGRLSDRPLVSQSETSLTVGTDTASIQEAINQIPLILRHNFEIQVPDGTYDENLLVPPLLVADSAGMNRDGTTNEGASHIPRITGDIDTPTNVQVNSFTVAGAQGAIAPLIEGFNIIGTAPYADEGAGVEIYGSQNVSFRWMSFAGGTARVGFLPYGSGVTIRQECDLGNDVLKFGVETKHNANVNIDHFSSATYSLTGSCTDYAIYNNDGGVVTFRDMQATGGIRDVYNREGVMYNANLMEYEPAIGARATSTVVDQSIASGTQTRVEFDQTEYDRRGDFDTTNNYFVVPESGRYQIGVQVQWLGPADTTELALNVEDVSGTSQTPLIGSRLNGSVHTNPTQAVSATLELSGGEELHVEVEHDEGSGVNINSDNDTLTYFTVDRLT